MSQYKKECEVKSKQGIHTRPSILITELVIKETNGQGGIFIKRKDDGLVTDASSITSMMIMGANVGVELVVYTNDKRYKNGVDKVVNLILNMPEFE